jgi:leucyl aminopeptidase
VYDTQLHGDASRYLVEAPPNICTPTHLANAAAKIAEGASDVMTLEVLEKEDCEKFKMGCYLPVAACSEEPLKFIHLTYKPKGELKHLCNVKTRFDCPQAFLSLDFHCRMNVFVKI